MISGDTKEAKPGDLVIVPVRMSVNPGIAGGLFQVSYDNSVMTLKSIQREEVTKKGSFTGDVQKGIVQWYDVEENQNTTATGTLFMLEFEVYPTAAGGDYAIGISLMDGDEANLTNIDSENVAVSFTNGVLKIAGSEEPSDDKFQVSFDSTGGTAVAAQTVSKGSLIKEPEKPTRENYYFGGWYRDSSYEIPWNFAIDTVTSDIILYAKWTEESEGNFHCVWFISYGGTPVPYQRVEKGKTVDKPEDPIRPGYDLVGWYENDKLRGEPWNFEKNALTKSTILYAKWRIHGITEASVDENALYMMAVKEKLDLSSDFGEQYAKYKVEPAGTASVSRSGLLTGKKPGVVKVTGRKKEGSIWVDGESITVQIVQPYFTTKTITSTYEGQLIFLSDYLVDHSMLFPDQIISSKPNVAEILSEDEQIIQVNSEGTTKITVVYGEGKNAARYAVNLKVAFPKLSKSSLTLQTGASAKLSLKNTKIRPNWEVENFGEDQIVSVDSNGKITALRAGMTTISTTIDDQTYCCEIEVIPPEIKKEKLTVKVGKKVSVGVKNTKLKNIVWDSEDPEIATVDNKGKVTGISVGKTWVYTETGGGWAACEITVTN